MTQFTSFVARSFDYGEYAFAQDGEKLIRIREITDPDLKRRIIEKLADVRGMSPAAVPEWYELDDADFVDLLNELKEETDPDANDPRM